MERSATADPHRHTGQPGFLGHIGGIGSAVADYLRARFQLAGLEGKEAAVHYGIILGLAIGALVVAVFGYFFLCLALVFAISWALGGGTSWIWVTGAFALLHFLGAGAFLFLAKNKLAQPMFTATLDEFIKDHEWLNTQTVRQH